MSFFDEGLQKEMQLKFLKAMSGDENYTIEDYTNEFSNTNLMNVEQITDDLKFMVKFVNESNNEDPEYATLGASGFDLRANEDTVLKAGEFKGISTGLYFELPFGYEIQVRPRSGLAFKNGVTVLNSPGTVDSDYRGEVKVILINHSKVDFKIAKGDRIAQAVIANVLAKNFINLTKVSSISNDTDRGTGGFGSTGLR
jgi:dUTP pyrophosphatase